MKLSLLARGRDNNFNLIRMLAACAVLVTHCFVLVSGDGNSEPMRRELGITMGVIAVDAFFVTSGFLVTASLFRTRHVWAFLWARTLRIFPALLVMLTITVFGVCAGLSDLSWSNYLKSPMTYRYFARCATLLAGVEYQLPGVFERNPYRAVVNGSLWTMPFEIRMYAILVLLGAVFGLLRATRARTFELCLVVLAVMAGASLLYLHFERPVENAFLRLFFMFFSGSAYFVLRDRISISLPTSAALLLAVVGTAWIGRDIFFVAYVLTLAYIILGFAYCRSEWAGKYNRLGDYSYGVYIYAFPVQQTVLALRPNTTVSELLCLSAPVTLTLAICSWHWIERHALAQKWRVGRGPSNRDTEKRRWL